MKTIKRFRCPKCKEGKEQWLFGAYDQWSFLGDDFRCYYCNAKIDPKKDFLPPIEYEDIHRVFFDLLTALRLKNKHGFSSLNECDWYNRAEIDSVVSE